MIARKQFSLLILLVAAIGLTSNASAQDRWRSDGYSNQCGAGVVCPYESHRGAQQNWYRSNGQFNNRPAQLEYMSPDYFAPDYRFESPDTCSHDSCQMRDQFPADGRRDQRDLESPCEFNCPYENSGGINNAFGNTPVPRYEQQGNAPDYDPSRQGIPRREPSNSADQIPRLNAPPSYDPPTSVPEYKSPNNSAPSDDNWQDVPATSPRLDSSQ